MEKWILFGAVPLLASLIIRLLHATVQVRFVGEEGIRSLWQEGRQVIISFWHDQLLLMVQGYRGKGAKILISSSKDGELIARTMHFFGQGAVRGSSSRGGRAAFKAMVEMGKEQVDLVITPDGPKGPRHQIKEGVVQLARLTGRPVVPMTFVCSRGYRFSSWDRFLLPFPFCKGVYSFGKPIFFAEGEKSEEFRQRLQTAMEDNDRQARACLEELGASAV